MIIKIPIYIEVLTKEDYDPTTLSRAVDDVIPEIVNNVIHNCGVFPATTEDFFDETGRRVAKRANVKRLSLSLIKKSEIFQKLNDRK